MLDQVINVIREADQPVSLHTLSKRLSIEQSALSGMLELLVRKEKLDIQQSAEYGNGDHCDTIQCMGCMKEKSCPFIAKMPVMYSLKETEYD